MNSIFTVFKTACLAALLCFFSVKHVYSQAGPPIQWQNTIGGLGHEAPNKAIQTADGGYLVVGMTRSSASGDITEVSNGGVDCLITKLSADGQTIEWQNTIGGNMNDAAQDVIQTADSGYVVIATSQSDISGDKTEANMGTVGTNDSWIFKLSADGQTILWQNTIGGNRNDNLESIIQTKDGGYLLCGGSNSDATGDKTEPLMSVNSSYGDSWVVKLSSDGQTIEWQNTIGGDLREIFYCAIQLADGSFMISGEIFTNTVSGDITDPANGLSDYWIIKLSADGQTVLSQKSIGGSEIDYVARSGFKQTLDGGFILFGTSNSPISGDKTSANYFNDYWVVKLAIDGQTIQWQRSLAGNGIDTGEGGIIQMADGGYVVAGVSTSGCQYTKLDPLIGNRDMWILKLSANGQTVQWQKTIGGIDAESLYSLLHTTDDAILLVGGSDSGISVDKTEPSWDELLGGNTIDDDWWLVKIGGPIIPTTMALLPAPAPKICLGDTVKLKAVSNRQLTYVWNPGGLTGDSVMIAPAATTTYTVQGLAPGCLTPLLLKTIVVTVNSAPAIDVSAAVGSCASFTLTATGGSSYSWAPATGLDATSGDVVTAMPTATTTYTVTGTNVNGCTASDTITITPGTGPTVIASATNLSACNLSTTLFATGAATYLWQPGGLTGDSVDVTPTFSTTYTVTGTDANGCANTATVLIKTCEIDLTLRLFLEGCYLAPDSLANHLYSWGLIPLAQPYNAPPFLYNGTENVTTLPANTIDWVLVELRDSANPTTVAARGAALLQADGWLNLVLNTPAGAYIPVVMHRNHTAIGSAIAVQSPSTTMLDLTIPANIVGGAGFFALTSDNRAALLAGDGNGNRFLEYDDYVVWHYANSAIQVYSPADYDMDGFITSGDYIFWVKNNSKFSYFTD